VTLVLKFDQLFMYARGAQNPTRKPYLVCKYF